MIQTCSYLGRYCWGGTLKFIMWKIMGNLFAVYKFLSSEQLQKTIKFVKAGIALLTLYCCLLSHGNNTMCCMHTKCMYTFIKDNYCTVTQYTLCMISHIIYYTSIYRHSEYIMYDFTHYILYIPPLRVYYVWFHTLYIIYTATQNILCMISRIVYYIYRHSVYIMFAFTH